MKTTEPFEPAENTAKHKSKIYKKRVRPFIRSVTSNLIIAFLIIVLKIPESIIWLISEIGGWVLCTFGFSLKKVAMNNLRIAYKDKFSRKELEVIARESMKNMVRMMCELTVFYRPSYLKALKDIPVEGEKYLKKALKNDKGVLIIGNHIGNFVLLNTALAKKGYKISFIFKEPKNEKLREFLRSFQAKISYTVIPVKPRKEAFKEAFDTLRRKEILYTSLDQDTRGTAIGVELFGVKAAMPSAPAHMILETQAVVLPVYTKRTGWLKHKIIVLEPIDVKVSGNNEKDVYNLLKRINSSIEQMILDNPREWWWIHRRWKRGYRYSEKTG